MKVFNLLFLILLSNNGFTQSDTSPMVIGTPENQTAPTLYYEISIPGKIVNGAINNNTVYKCEDITMSPAKCLTKVHKIKSRQSAEILINESARVLINSPDGSESPINCGVPLSAKSCLEVYSGQVIQDQGYYVTKSGKTYKCNANENTEICLSKINPLTEKQIEEMNSNENKYSDCNKWMASQFPRDNMMYIKNDGSVVKGSAATEFFDQNGNTSTAKNSNIDPNSKDITQTVETKIIRGANNSGFIVNRTYDSGKKAVYKNSFSHGNQITFLPEIESTTAEFRIGTNGKCYVSKVKSFQTNQKEIIKADSKRCNALKNFHEKYPEIKNCVNPSVFSELSFALDISDKKVKVNNYGKNFNPNLNFNSGNLLSKSLMKNFSKDQKNILKSIEEAKACDQLGLQKFYNDDSLFAPPGPSPASSTETSSTSIKE